MRKIVCALLQPQYANCLHAQTEGCNKVTCTCGAFICFVCGKKISGYSHFRDGDCILFDDGELDRQAALWNVQFARCCPGLPSQSACQPAPPPYALSGSTHLRQNALSASATAQCTSGWHALALLVWQSLTLGTRQRSSFSSQLFEFWDSKVVQHIWHTCHFHMAVLWLSSGSLKGTARQHISVRKCKGADVGPEHACGRMMAEARNLKTECKP